MENQVDTIINSLQHVGIPVSNIFESESFYARLGLENVMQSTFLIDDEAGTCIMMKNKAVIIDLYQMPEKQWQEIRARKNGHFDHIAYNVDDVDKTISTLKESSFTMVEESPAYLPSFWKKGCKYINILGPDGERLEFNQIV
jgi:catechol 2,3-dioxygenase-like lactoylglutathione lyase family enzyme